jgi:hypothetical protein
MVYRFYFKPLYAPKEILILEEFKIFMLLFYKRMHANYQLTNEIPSFVIYYSNKALSNQSPFHKSVKNPLDQNKDFSFNLQTFSRALRREQRLFTSYYRSVKIEKSRRVVESRPMCLDLYSLVYTVS